MNKMIEVASLVANLSDEDKAIAKHIVGRGGLLRSSKPKDAEGSYVWRMVAFYLSSNPQHHCMPVLADAQLWEIAPKKVTSWSNGKLVADQDWIKNRCKELDVIVDKIVNQVPVNQQAGTKRWARAFGVI